MTKTSMARDLSREQTESNLESARSTAESQRLLARNLDRAATDMSTITQEFRGSLLETEQTLETATKRAEAVLSSGVKEIRDLSAAAAMLPDQVDRFRIASIVVAMVAGATTWTLCLIALLILHPPLIQALWQASQALRGL